MNPTHYDGDEIRCANKASAMKLFSIDAPRLPGDCRTGRACVPGNPIAARDYLRELTHNKKVSCTSLDPNRTGSRDVRCAADGIDLSCAMVASGFALEREHPLSCDKLAVPKPTTKLTAEARDFAQLSPTLRLWVPIFLLAVNIITYFAFVADKNRARSGLNRIADIHLLTLVFFGGGIGALVAQQRHEHMRTEQPFATQFAILIGLQFGTIIGLTGMLLWPLAAK
nr:DUF1294 domain-containing protein [Polymorphobacter sp.]